MKVISSDFDERIVDIVKKVMFKLRNIKSIETLSKHFSNENDIECRILCCKTDINDLLLCLTSYYLYSQYYLDIHIHEDGSFDHGCIDLINEIFPFVNVVTLKQATNDLKNIIQDNKLHESRNKLLKDFKFHTRFIDFPLLSKKSRILSMDTDCFYFANPSELFDLILANKSYIHCQGRFFSHGNAERILHDIGFENKLNLKDLPKPGAHLIVYPTRFFINNSKLVQSFIDYLILFGAKWCDEQGFFDITLKNNFPEAALSDQTYVGTFWENEVSLEHYDFIRNESSIKVIHCSSNAPFMELTKSKLMNLLQLFLNQ